MKWNRPSSLGKSVEVQATNRPIKIAYLVPFDDTPHTHKILEAVFFESYTRWAGVYTLIVPTNPQGFLTDQYDEWLKHYDPDFVYSYVDLTGAFIDKIDRLCCPIACLTHEGTKQEDREIDWRSLLPRWDHYIRPVSSISTVSSPASYPKLPHAEQPREHTVFTQYGSEPSNRFLADNFGTAFHLHNVTHAIPGLFKTLCLVPADLPAHMEAGTERCLSVLEAFRAISNRKATPIARLAMVNSAGVPRPESLSWAFSFRVFIGNTPLDRIHFWNCRHLGSSWSDSSNALILEPAFFDDEELVKQLGHYLNKHNFLSHSNGPYQAAIHSSSVAVDVLNGIRDKLKPYTSNAVLVSKAFDAQAIPTKRDLEERIYGKSNDTSSFKLTEDSNEVDANAPAHLTYLPPQLKGLASGQWIVELSIQRHHNLSRYSNVIDTWTLPRRRKIARAFTDRLAKPTSSGRLALLPSINGFPFRDQAVGEANSYEIHLPSDEVFFRHLALDFFKYPKDDLRAAIPSAGYVDLMISDKGQNLRGVISLFDSLFIAYEILTNKFWRSVFAEANTDSVKPLTFDLNKLCSLIPNDQETIKRLTEKLNLSNRGITKNYLRDSLKDSLEYLVRLNVFFQVAHWSCSYCGHVNSRSLDNMKTKNACDICEAEYFSPIEIDWQYELNGFVYRSLQKHSGLPVLWTLGFLQDRTHTGSFWYLPEVDFLERDDDPESKKEMDILAMSDGMFFAVEAKLSASTFINKEGAVDRFVNLIARLRPDVALLAFERYCVPGEDEEPIKVKLAEAVEVIQERIGPWIKLEILVTQDIAEFDDFPDDLGWYGPRVRKYH